MDITKVTAGLLTLALMLSGAGCVSDDGGGCPAETPSTCGDGMLQADEMCDDGNPGMFDAQFGEHTCASLMPGSKGQLQCRCCDVDTSKCEPREDGCPDDTPASCGNGRIDPGESCDQGQPDRGIDADFGTNTCASTVPGSTGPLICECCMLNPALCVAADQPMGGSGR